MEFGHAEDNLGGKESVTGHVRTMGSGCKGLCICHGGLGC